MVRWFAYFEYPPRRISISGPWRSRRLALKRVKRLARDRRRRVALKRLGKSAYEYRPPQQKHLPGPVYLYTSRGAAHLVPLGAPTQMLLWPQVDCDLGPHLRSELRVR